MSKSVAAASQMEVKPGVIEPPILEREIKRVKRGRYVLIPASEDTRGHGTTGMARLWTR